MSNELKQNTLETFTTESTSTSIDEEGIVSPLFAEGFVDSEDDFDTALIEVESGQIGQKVVATEEQQEEKVVNETLRVFFGLIAELHDDVLAQQADFEGVVVLGARKLGDDAATAQRRVGSGAKDHLLAQDAKVGLVGGQRQDDEIGVQTVEAVLGVGIVAWLRADAANVVHDFVLAFAWRVGS